MKTAVSSLKVTAAKVVTTCEIASAIVILLSILVSVLVRIVHLVGEQRATEHTCTQTERCTTSHAHTTSAAAKATTTSTETTTLSHHGLLSVHGLLLRVAAVAALLRIAAILWLAVWLLLVVLLRWLLTPAAVVTAGWTRGRSITSRGSGAGIVLVFVIGMHPDGTWRGGSGVDVKVAVVVALPLLDPSGG